MKRRLLSWALRIFCALTNERVQLELWARLGPRFAVSVWAVVVDDRRRVLLFRHALDHAHPWGLPSGRLEANEPPEQGLQREFREEVGGAIRPQTLVAALTEPRPPALRLVFRCAIVEPPATPSFEVSEWRYFAPADLPALRSSQRLAITLALGDLDPSSKLESSCP